MPPKFPKKPDPVPPRPVSTLASEYDKLTTCIQNGWETDKEISDPKTFIALKGLLRAQREKSTIIETKFIEHLVRVLENGKENICGRLDPSLFSIVIDTILQSDYSRESERGLYLLADSLHCEGKEGNTISVTKRKELIGSNSLNLMLERFVDTSGNTALRRWVGILCIQLLQHASLNIDRLEYGSDTVRQSIGRLITEDENEIVKYVCGKLVRALQQANIDIRSLWPNKTSNVVFDEFPSSTQEDGGWSQQFQTYLDTVYDSQISQHRRSDVLLYFASKCELHPYGIIGTPGHVKNMLITADRITIQAPSSQEFLDAILDIPRTAISVFKITATQEPQSKGSATATFEIKEGTDDYCCLNGEIVLLSRISLLMPMDMIQNLRDDFPGAYGEIKVLDDEVPFPQRVVVNSHAPILTGSDDDEYQPNSEADELGNLAGARPVDSQEAFITGGDDELYDLNDSQPDGPNNDEDALQGVYQSHGYVGVGWDEDKPVAVAGRSRVAKKVTKVIRDGQSEPAPNKEAIPNETATNDVDQPIAAEDLYSASPPKKVTNKLQVLAAVEFSKESKTFQETSLDVPSQLATPGSESLNELDAEEPELPVTKNAVRRKAKKPIQVSQERRSALVLAEQERANKTERVMAKMSAPAASSQPTSTHLEISSPLSEIYEHDSSTPKATKAFQETKNTVSKKLQASNGKILGHSPETLVAPKDTEGKTQSSAEVMLLPPKSAMDSTYDLEPDDDEESVPSKAKKNETKRTTKKKHIIYSTSAKEAKKVIVRKNSTRKKRQSATVHLEQKEDSQGRTTRTKYLRKSQVNKENSEVEPQDTIKDAPERASHKKHPRKSKESKDVHVSQIHHSVEKSRTKTINAVQRKPPKDPRQGTKADENAKRISRPNSVAISLVQVESGIDEVPSAFEALAAEHYLFNHGGAERCEEDCVLTKNQAPSAPAKNIDELAIGPELVLPSVATVAAKTLSKQAVLNPTVSNAWQNVGRETSTLVDKTEISQMPEIQYELQRSETPAKSIPGSAQSGYSLKRKPKAGKSTSSKRRRLDQSEVSCYLRMRSPRIEGHPGLVNQRPGRAAAAAEEAQTSSSIPAPVNKRTNAKATAKMTPTKLQKRISPRLAGQEQNDGEVPEILLVDETVHRKITLIEFDKNGPLNQGRSKSPQAEVIKSARESPSLAHSWLAKKRSVDVTEGNGDIGPPRKRQYSSPVDHDDEDQGFVDIQEGAMSSLEISENDEPIAPSTSQYRAKAKTSLQSSRVTAKGSPMAPTKVAKVDHNIKAQQEVKEMGAPIREVEQLKAQGRGRSHSTLFGAKVILTSQSKTRPSSPDKQETRYVRHHKTNSGQFEHAQTKKLIPMQVVLPDPFVETTRTSSSSFAERLRKHSGDIGRNLRGPAHVPQFAVQKSAKSKVSVARKKVSRALLEDPERTLVREDSVSLMPSRSSTSSQDQHRELSRNPMKEISPNGKWTMALRPHYTNLHDAVHRVADDMLVRLSEEEDSIGLVVAQYQENGSMILSNVVRKRNEEKTRMLGGLLGKRNCLLAAYEESKKAIKKTTEVSKENSAISYEKEWKTKQLSIRGKIADGRRGLD